MWVDLLQDAAIVALSVAQIVQAVGSGRQRERLGSVEGKLKTVGERSLMRSSHDEDMAFYELIEATQPGNHCSRKTKRGLYPYLFGEGDEVLVDGLDETLTLTGFEYGKFTATGEGASGCRLTVAFSPEDVVAWRRTTGEWPVNWFRGDSDGSRGTCGATRDEGTTNENGGRSERQTSRPASLHRGESSDSDSVRDGPDLPPSAGPDADADDRGWTT